MVKKVYILKQGIIDKVYLLGVQQPTDPNKKTQLLNQLFSKEEIPVNIHYIPHIHIYPDDSISQIKKKIIEIIGEPNLTYFEIHIFAFIQYYANILSMYQNITQNEKQRLTREQFQQFLINIDASPDIIQKYLKTESTVLFPDFNTFIELGGVSVADIRIPTGLGQQFVKFDDFIYSANPYDILPNSSPAFSDSKKNGLLFFENQLLLNHGTIVDDSIYVCLADDVFEYVNKSNIHADPTYIAKTYFHHLADREIYNIQSLQQKREQIIKENKTLVNARFTHQNQVVDAFYQVYHGKKTVLPYKEKGIKEFRIAIRPYDATTVELPLEAIFKNIHCSREIPFINYNPGIRRDKICRFYSNRYTHYGRKIPFLPKNTVNQLVKRTAKHRQISVWLDTPKIVMDLEPDGNIYIRNNEFEPGKPMSVEELNTTIRTYVNPVIQAMNSYLNKSGYQLREFVNMADNFVETISLDYVLNIDLKRKFTMDSGCVNVVFDTIRDEFDKGKGAILRYKRVENFKEMTGQYGMMSEVYRQTGRQEDVIQSLTVNYQISVEEALEIWKNYLKEVNLIVGREKQIRIVENPGLLTNILVNSANGNMNVRVEGIPHISYVDCFDVYMDTMIRVSQEPESSDAIVGYKKLAVKKLGKVGIIQSMKNVEQHKDHQNPLATIQPDFAKFQGALDDIFDNEGEKSKATGDRIEDFKPEIEQLSEIKEEGEGEGEGEAEEEFGIEENETSLSSPEKSQSSTESSAFSLVGVEDLSFASEEESKESEGETKESKESKESKELSTINSEDLVGIDSLSKGGAEGDDYIADMGKGNQFLKRLQKYDPVLFSQTKIDGKMKAYARACPATDKRLPVVLTDEEKAKIDQQDQQNGNKSYSYAIRQGSDPNKQHWYVCPRYWCFKTNTSMSEEEVKNNPNACGANNENLYEFNSGKKEHIKNGQYKPHHPGYIKNTCLPCCFAKEFSQDKLKKCKKNPVEPVDDRPEEPEKVKKTQHRKQKREPSMDSEDDDDDSESDDESIVKPPLEPTARDIALPSSAKYVVGVDKYPVATSRLGFLQVPIQLFLQMDYRPVIQKQSSALIIDDANVLLRMGVEQSANLSFLGCMAYFYGALTNSRPLSVKDGAFQKHIASAVDLDTFAEMNNGSLITSFKPKRIVEDELDLETHSNSKIYKTMKTNDESYDTFVDIVASYENFIAYLRDTTTTINHVHLWDIFSRPNPRLFPQGINLLIMEITGNDITQNVDLICPTTAYSSTLFDLKKRTAMIVKQYEFYEPVIAVRDYRIIHNVFSVDVVEFPYVQRVLKMVNDTFNKYCIPGSSQPRVYEFEHAPKIETIIQGVGQIGYTVVGQVVNYQGKTVAVLVQKQGVQPPAKSGSKPIYIPCFPAQILKNIDTVFINNVEWNTYIETRKALNQIYLAIDIPCQPKMKIIEDGMIVGILTASNQFVQIDPPQQNVEGEDNLVAIDDHNYLLTDKELITAKKGDEERISTIRRIHGETEFYSGFRSHFKMLFSMYENKGVREKILGILKSKNYTHRAKLDMLVRILKKMVTGIIVFNEMDDDVIEQINLLSEAMYICGEARHALYKRGCKMVLPKKNLITGKDNEMLYFYKLADELARYKRIQQYMLQPKQYMNLGNVYYKVNPDELILSESFFNTQYFELDEPFENYGYVHNVGYHNAQPDPVQSARLSGHITLEEQQKYEVQGEGGIMDNVNHYKKQIGDVLGNKDNYWKKNVFDKTVKEITFQGTVEASFGPLLYILQDKGRRIYTIGEIKQQLIQAYSEVANKMPEILRIMMRFQGKPQLLSGVSKGTMTMEEAIISDPYFLTVMDIYVYCYVYKLPVILFSSSFKMSGMDLKFVEEGNISHSFLVMGGSINDRFYFVRAPSEVRTTKMDVITEGQMIMGNFTIQQMRIIGERVRTRIEEKIFPILNI